MSKQPMAQPTGVTGCDPWVGGRPRGPHGILGDVVVMVLCGERAGEVLETILDFSEMEDPRIGGKLIDCTVMICNTSSMPVDRP